MKLIVGLGNIGDKYKNTRHNTGFKAIDFIIQKLNVKLNKIKFNGEFYKEKNFIIGKPHTFMNLSGDFVFDISKFYKIDIDDILIIYDDMNLNLEEIKYRESGSSGGHNGINDIMVKFDTNKIKRLRIGIGKPRNETINHVLSNFKKEEWDKIISKKNEIINFVFDFIEVNKNK